MPDASPPATPAADGGPSARLVLATAPPDRAEDVARRLVDERLAACVNVVPGLRSIYRWKGEVLDDPETLLVMKTRADRLDALRTRFLELHPYEVPEFVVLAPADVEPRYLAWLRGVTAPEDGSA